MACITRWHGTVKKLVSHTDAFHNAGRMANAEAVHWKLAGNQLACVRDDFCQKIALTVYRPTAIAIAVKAYFEQGIGTLPTQLLRCTSLNHGKQPWTLLWI